MIVIKSNGTNHTTSVYNDSVRIKLIQSIDLTIDDVMLTKCVLDLTCVNDQFLLQPNERNDDDDILILEVGHLIKYSNLIYKGRNLIQEFASENKKIYRISFETKVDPIDNDELKVKCHLSYCTLVETETEDGFRRDPAYNVIDCFSIE